MLYLLIRIKRFFYPYTISALGNRMTDGSQNRTMSHVSLFLSFLQMLTQYWTPGIDKNHPPFHQSPYRMCCRELWTERYQSFCLSKKAQSELQMVISAVNNSLEEIYAVQTDRKLIFANKEFIHHYGTVGQSSYIFDILSDLTETEWQTNISK